MASETQFFRLRLPYRYDLEHRASQMHLCTGKKPAEEVD